MDDVSKTLMRGFESTSCGTLESDRTRPWTFMVGWLLRRELVMRRASLLVKPAMATVLVGMNAGILL